jgi:CBS domain-containing protein
MKADVEYCRREENVEAAAERMRRRNVGFLPVCDGAGAIVGTITDRDLAMRVLGEHRSAGTTVVGDIMSSDVVYCSPDDDLEIAESLMAQHKKSRIVCTDELRHPVGVISLSDIARVEEASTLSGILESIASREAPRSLTLEGTPGRD